MALDREQIAALEIDLQEGRRAHVRNVLASNNAEDADDSRIASRVARLFQELGHLQSARVWVERALELSPCDAHILSQAGIIHSDLNRDKVAILYFQRSLDLAPRPHVYHLLANSYWLCMDSESALAAVNKAIELEDNPEYLADLRMNAAEFELYLDRPAASILILEQLESEGWLNAYGEEVRGRAEMQLNNPALAAEYFRRSIEHGRDGEFIHLHHGLALRRLGLWDEAECEYRKALEISPTPTVRRWVAQFLRAKRMQ